MMNDGEIKKNFEIIAKRASGTVDQIIQKRSQIWIVCALEIDCRLIEFRLTQVSMITQLGSRGILSLA